MLGKTCWGTGGTGGTNFDVVTSGNSHDDGRNLKAGLWLVDLFYVLTHVDYLVRPPLIVKLKGVEIVVLGVEIVVLGVEIVVLGAKWANIVVLRAKIVVQEQIPMLFQWGDCGAKLEMWCCGANLKANERPESCWLFYGPLWKSPVLKIDLGNSPGSANQRARNKNDDGRILKTWLWLVNLFYVLTHVDYLVRPPLIVKLMSWSPRGTDLVLIFLELLY